MQMGRTPLSRSSQRGLFVGWSALLATEVVGLTWFFDFQSVHQALGYSSWLQALIGQSGQLLRLAGAFVIVALIHGGSSWKEELDTFGSFLSAWPSVALRLIVHLVALIGFVEVTARLIAFADSSLTALSGLLLLNWVVMVPAVGFTWLSIGLPPSGWLSFWKRRRFSLGIALLGGSLAWLAGLATAHLWRPMVGGTFALVRWMTVPWAGDQLICDPDRALIGTPTFGVEIAPACSGYEGIGLVWVVIGAYLWLFRGELRFPRALVLLPLATALSWFTNAVRIAVLLFVGNFISPEIAGGGFHSQAGWLAFNAITLGLIAASRHLTWFQRPREVPKVETIVTENPTVAYLAPLMAVVVTMMMTTAISAGFDRFYGLRIVAGALALFHFRKSYREINWSVSIGSIVGGVAVFGLWLGLEPPDKASSSSLHSEVEKLGESWRILWIVLRVLGSTLLIPVIEEVAFRGYLSRRLISAAFEEVDPRTFTLLSLLGSSLLFGAMHQRFVAGTVAGLVYGWIYHRRGSLGDAVLAHAVTNGMIAVSVLGAGWWSLWS